MGQVASLVARRIQRFNVENRAHRYLEREKLAPAPRYDGNLRDMERTLELDPEFLDKLNRKDDALDDRLKNVYVTSQDSFIDYGVKGKNAAGDKSLPLSRTTPEDFEYGFMEPVRVTRGRCTLRQAIKFITEHQGDPEYWTVQKIAEQYKMKEESVENIVTYFRSFNVYIPDKRSRDKILTQSAPKLLPAEKDEQKSV